MFILLNPKEKVRPHFFFFCNFIVSPEIYFYFFGALKYNSYKKFLKNEKHKRIA